MKKNLNHNLLLAMLFVLPAFFFSACSEKATEAEEVEYAVGSDAVFFSKKGDDNGQFPTGMRSQWMSHNRQMDQEKSGGNYFQQIVQLGPNGVGGRTRAICSDRTDAQRVIAGAASGGIWLSTNQGDSWTPKFDDKITLSISDIVQDPFDDDVFWACTGEAVPGGEGHSGFPGEGIFKSTDSGDNWNQVSGSETVSGLTRTWRMAVGGTSTNPLLFVGTKDDGLLASTDGGATWLTSYAPSGVKAITDVLTFTGGGVMFSERTVGVFYSPTGIPGTFTAIVPGTLTGFNRIEIENSAADEGKVYALFGNSDGSLGSKYFGSFEQNGSGTWVYTALTKPGTGYTQGSYQLMLGVSDDDPDLLVAGAKRVVVSTTGGVIPPGGTAWTSNSSGHSDSHVAVPILGTDKFFVGNDGGIYKHKWYATGFKVGCNSNYHVTQFLSGNYAPTGETVIAGAIDNGTYRIESSSRREVLGGDGSFCHISQQTPSIAYAQRQKGGMFGSSNFRASNPGFAKLTKPLAMKQQTNNFYNENQINYADGNQLYTRTNSGFWRTLDAGNSFNELASGNVTQIDAIGVSQDADPNVYLARTPGNSTEIFRFEEAASITATNDYTLVTGMPAGVVGDVVGGITVSPTDPNTIFIAFSGNVNRQRAYMVENCDGTPNWVNMNTKNNLPFKLGVNKIEVDPAAPSTTWFLATDMGLYYTTDAGTNWYHEDGVPNVIIPEARLRVSDRRLYLFTKGRGVWYLDLPNPLCAQQIVPNYADGFESAPTWTDDPGADNAFALGNGPSASTTTGPQSGANEGSRYLYTEGTAAGEVSSMTSPCFDFTTVEDPQFKFDYHLFGAGAGTVTVSVRANAGDWEEIWTRSGNQGSQWYTDRILLSDYGFTPRVQYKIDYTTGGATDNQLAIDLIEVRSSPGCVDLEDLPDVQSFESGMGHYNHFPNATQDWLEHTGATPTANTGPTAAADGSKYLYVEATSTSSGDEVIFQSQCIDMRDWYSPQIDLDYHLYGDDIGTLKIASQVDVLPWVDEWVISGDQGNQWGHITIDLGHLAGQTYVTMKFIAILTGGDEGDIAVDNVVISDNNCNREYPLGLSFEGPSWTDQGIWLHQQGGSAGANTGPEESAEGQRYYYVDATSSPNTTANLDLICYNMLDLTSAEAAFSYHMWGSDMGDLYLESSIDGGAWTVEKTLSGDQGNVWKTTSVNVDHLTGNADVAFRFRAVTGNGPNSMMAVDNFIVREANGCSSEFPFADGFETGFSSWTQDPTDDGDWVRTSGATPTPNSGPTSAHEGNFYAYSTGAGGGKVWVINLESPCFNLSGQSELIMNFAALMYGPDVGTLAVQARVGSGAWETVWDISGSYGQNWHEVEVDLSEAAGFDNVQFRFYAEHGATTASDIAIDDVQLTLGQGPISVSPEDLPGAEADPTDVEPMNVRFYPNPFAQTLQLDLPTTLQGEVSVQVFNPNGMLLLSQQSVGGKSLELPGEHLAAGLYLLKVTADNYNRGFRIIKK